MAEYNPFTSLTETYLENRRRLAAHLSTTSKTPALPPSLSQPSSSSAAKHPMFGPIPPQLLHKYVSPNLSYSLDHQPSTPLPPPDRSHPPPLCCHTHICAPSSQQLPKPVSQTLQSSSPFTQTHVEIIDIEDDPLEPPFKNDIVTHNNHLRDVIIIEDEDEDENDDHLSFCDLIAKHKNFILEEISKKTHHRISGSGTVGSMSELKGKKIADNSISTKRKIDDIYPRSD